MTTVADLVAKLGFKVDDSGFNKFKDSLQSFQSVIREGLKDLKEYAKEAEKISKIISRGAYVPTKEEARDRYLARTKQMKLNAESYKKRTDLLNEQLAVKKRQDDTRNRSLDFAEKNTPKMLSLREASIRFKEKYALQTLALKELTQSLKKTQLSLKERQLDLNREKFEYQKEKDEKRSKGRGGFLAMLGAMFGGKTLLGDFLGLVGSLFGPIGTLIGRIVGDALTKISHVLLKGLTWLWGQIKQGIAYAMAFRDYRSFTGRNSSELSNLIGMTRNTTNLTPQDVLKDVVGIEQSYWDMWFGGGNPAIWQTLGIMPTGNGARDIKTLLGAIHPIYKSNKGLALNLLKQAGLSEDYMNILSDWESYKQGGGELSFAGFTDEQISHIEDANKSLKEFSLAVNQVKIEIIDYLLKSGLNEILRDIVNYIKGLFLAIKSGKVDDWKSFGREVFSFERMKASGESGEYIYRSGWEKRKRAEKIKQDILNNPNSLFTDITREKGKPDWITDMLSNASLKLMGNSTNVVNNYENNFDFAGRTTDELEDGYSRIQKQQNQNMASNLFSGNSLSYATTGIGTSQ